LSDAWVYFGAGLMALGKIVQQWRRDKAEARRNR
jgi:hypothetical protein